MAFEEIERLYAELDNSSALVQVYLNLYEVMEEQEVRTDLLLAAATQYEEKIGDEESAFLILQKAYLEDYGNEKAINQVERITAKIGRWEELIGVVNNKLAELGNRNRPLDMVVYEKAGEGYVLMANSARGLMKISMHNLSEIEPLTARVEDKAGLGYETIAELEGVVQLDRLNKDKALVLVDTGEGQDLKTINLP